MKVGALLIACVLLCTVVFAEDKVDRIDNEDAAIVLDKEAVRAFTTHLYELGELDKKMSEAEIELMSKHPDEWDDLAKIALTARERSEEAYNKDNNVPRDAYNHVLWSYLLTKKYGSEFAEEVTNAHEEGDNENTAFEHAMDYKNNENGRKYALSGFEEDSILERLQKDPEVVRIPD